MSRRTISMYHICIKKHKKSKAEAQNQEQRKALHLIASLSTGVPVFCTHCLFAERMKLQTSSAQPEDRSSEDADSASLDSLIHKTCSKHHENTTAENIKRQDIKDNSEKNVKWRSTQGR